jgi:hypothetical protein
MVDSQVPPRDLAQRRPDGRISSIARQRRLFFHYVCLITILHDSFYTAGPLVDMLSDFFGCRRPEDLRQAFNRDNDRRKAIKYLRNVSINITYTNAIGRRKYKIGGLSAPSLLTKLLLILMARR